MSGLRPVWPRARDSGVIGLSRRWSRPWLALRATAIPDVTPILARWAEPHRQYHTVAHLAHCLATYDRNPLRDAPVELALWFHDVIYDPQAGDNEEHSAALARTAAASAGLSSEIIDVITQCILATRHRDPPTTSAQALTLDVDLAILGATRRRFDSYDAAVRAEYAWVPVATYHQERARILARFAQRDDLFTTRWFRQRYAAPARVNLRRALRRLEIARG